MNLQTYLVSREHVFSIGIETDSGLIYVRFSGTAECPEPVAYHNRLFNDALRFGREISREEYERGFPFR